MTAQIHFESTDLDQLVCEGETLRGSRSPPTVAVPPSLPRCRITPQPWASPSARPDTPLTKTVKGGAAAAPGAGSRLLPVGEGLPTRKPCTGRSATSVKEGARSLLWHGIMRSATGERSSERCRPKRAQSTSLRPGSAPAGSTRCLFPAESLTATLPPRTCQQRQASWACTAARPRTGR